MNKIYTYGEVLAENMRELPNQDLSKRQIFHGPFIGGAPAVFISTAARLGNETKIWAGVGADKFGDAVIERLQKDGVNTTHIKRSDKPTAVSFVSYDDQGEREFIFHINNTAADNFKFIKDPEVPACFHVNGCTMMASERFKIGIEHATDYYSHMGAEISFDPNIRPELLKEKSFNEVAGKIMEECTIFLPGVGELLLAAYNKEIKISDKNDKFDIIDKAVTTLFKKYAKIKLINIKLGGDGSIIYKRNESPIHIPVYNITSKEPLKDATGAGDTFDATFISSYLNGDSLERAGFLASKAGALNVVAFGPLETDLNRLNEKILPVDDDFF